MQEYNPRKNGVADRVPQGPEKPGFIYAIEAVGGHAVKVGWSGTKDGVRKRLLAMRTGNHCELRVIGVLEGTNHQERLMHRKLRPYRIHSEWFTLKALDHLNLDDLDGTYVHKCVRCGELRKKMQPRESSHCRKCIAELHRSAPIIERCIDCSCTLGRSNNLQPGTPRRCRGCAMRVAWKDPEYVRRRWEAQQAAYEARRALNKTKQRARRGQAA